MAYVKRTMQIEGGDRIAQLLLLPYLKGKAGPICRTGGLGSTEEKVFGKLLLTMRSQS